jgi:hypothetical protein
MVPQLHHATFKVHNYKVFYMFMMWSILEVGKFLSQNYLYQCHQTLCQKFIFVSSNVFVGINDFNFISFQNEICGNEMK